MSKSAGGVDCSLNARSKNFPTPNNSAYAAFVRLNCSPVVNQFTHPTHGFHHKTGLPNALRTISVINGAQIQR